MSGLDLSGDSPLIVDRTMPVERLGEIAVAAYARSRESAAESLRYAIECGRALDLGKAKLEGQPWEDWIRSLGISRTTAYKYRRLARNAGQLDDFDGGIEDALLAISDPWSRPRLTAAQKTEAVRMMERDGLTHEQAAELLGVSPSTVWYWASKKNRTRRGAHRRRTRSRARMAEIELRRREGDRLSRQTDGAASKGYALLRRAAQEIDAARGAEVDPEARTALERALGHIYEAEAEAVRALGRYVEAEAA